MAASYSCAEDAVPAAASVGDQTAVNKKMIHINYQATQIKQQRSLFKELKHNNETVKVKVMFVKNSFFTNDLDM